MKMSKRVILLAVTVIVLGLIAGGLVYFLQPRGEKEVKIGAVFSQTGPIAPYGKKALQGVELAVEQINKTDGIKGAKIRLIVEDAKSTSKDAVSACQKLITVDKVPVIIGPLSSGLALACAPIANREKVILFSPGAASPDYSTPDDYTFRNWPTSNLIAGKMAEVAHGKLGLSRVAILHAIEDASIGYQKDFSNKFRALGGTIVAVESFEPGSTDMRAQLTKIKATAPEGIYVLGKGAELGYVLKQIKELGIDARVISWIGIEAKEVLDIAGDAAEGVIYTLAAYNPYDPNPRVQQYEKAYEARYGEPSDAFAAASYDAVFILKEAMEKAGFDPTKIKDALFQISNFPGVSGTTSFDRNGDVIKSIAIKMVKDGKFVFLDENLNPMGQP
jgi:branched-chain amino acid transport system substrate-binding protein